jgi:tetratricopeptide (TPR) repeat protein
VTIPLELPGTARLAPPAFTPAAARIPDDRAFAAPAPRSALDVLRGVTSGHRVIEDFTPLTRSLAWRLAEQFWATSGVAPFVGNEVPFVVTSNGRLSEDAAAVLLANCLDAPPADRIIVLELGAGSGLFARYFLDAFRAMATETGSDFYDRLTYCVSDGSARSVAQWTECGLFAEHAGHVVMGTCDALAPGGFRPADGAAPPGGPLRAVFCNYALDVLPASIVRRGTAAVEELCVRTALPNDEALLRQYTRLAPSDIAAAARDADAKGVAALLPLVSVLHLETAFVPARDGGPPCAERALALAPDGSRVVVSHGALASLRECLRLLDDDGFVLVSDYGPVRAEDAVSQAGPQRFGRSLAMGINFPFLEAELARDRVTALGPDGDEEWPIHSRLVARHPLSGTAAAFATRFAIATHRAREEPAQEARAQRGAAREDLALDAYRRAVEQRPRDWFLLGEVAEFVGLQLRDFAAGVELARAALARNPWYSAWLWNVLGDCQYCLGDFDAAHESYARASRIDATDARTNLNLAYTLFQYGAHGDALTAIATGLAADVGEQYRASLLQKQQEILAALAERRRAEEQRMARGIPLPP